MTHDVILRFRSHRVALTDDIIIWFDDVWADQPKVIVLRFIRVVFGVSYSPFLLNATISHHIEQYRAQDPV